MIFYYFLCKYVVVNVDKYLYIDNGFFFGSFCNLGGY